MSTGKKKAARYIRVSRSDQNPQLQSDETADLIARRGWALEATFVDHGVSGAKDRRPELNRLLEAAKKRQFDVLVVWRSDRLFRSLKHMVTTLGELAALGIDFVSVTEPFDTSTPQGRLLLHIVSAFAEFERGILIERTRAGLAAARRRGARIGRPPAKVDMARFEELRASGASVRQMARALAIGPTTVHRILRTAGTGGVPIPGPDSEDVNAGNDGAPRHRSGRP